MSVTYYNCTGKVVCCNPYTVNDKAGNNLIVENDEAEEQVLEQYLDEEGKCHDKEDVRTSPNTSRTSGTKKDKDKRTIMF